mgnify:CR=1 FL=1
MPTWIDALASRSGPLHTAATEFAAFYGLERDPPRGVGGLHALSRLINGARLERHEVNEDAVDEDAVDRDFVTGAGAYLGLLLLDHLQDGSHVTSSGEHRLRLGEHGFFDPFAAVAKALIGIAHPKFREELEAGAARRRLL